MKKLLTLLGLIAMASVLFVGCPGSTSDTPSPDPKPVAPTEVTIWEGEVVLDDSWNGDLAGKIEAEKFAEVVVGGTVKIYANGTAQIKANADGWPPFDGLADQMDPTWGNITAKDVIVFVLGEKDVADLKASGMVLFGAGITYTKVTYTAPAAN